MGSKWSADSISGLSWVGGDRSRAMLNVAQGTGRGQSVGGAPRKAVVCCFVFFLNYMQRIAVEFERVLTIPRA